MNNTSGTSVTPEVDKPKLIAVTPCSKKLHASIPSHSVPQPREFNVVKHRNVIAPRMFKINPSQTSRVDLVPNKQSSASIRTNPITNFQCHVTVIENVSSDMVNASSTGLVHTARTKRPQPKGNTRNVRVLYASKSSEVKKNVTVEDHRRTLLLSKNQKTIANQKRHRTQVWKPKQVGSKERLAPKPRLPRFSLKWSPSGRSFDLKGKLAASKETNSPNDDKACTSNPQEPMRKRFQIQLCFLAGTVRFGNDHIAAILGYGDLKWGNITITRVYFVKGLGHNLFLVGQFCDAGLEVAFRRNTYFIRELDVFDLLKGITHETSAAKTSQQNGVVERRNCTLVEATRTMLIFSHASLFLWAEAIATACYTQNRSIVHIRFNKTPYELIQGRKPDISYLYVFGALCYPKNDHEDISKLGAKGDIGFFIGYSANSVAYRVYNRWTKKIMETMNVTFDELLEMASLLRFDDDILVVQVYVDDIIFGSTDPIYGTLFSDLMKSRFEMSMMGEMTFFLGLQVNQSPSGIFINQSNYVNEIPKKYGLNTCSIIGTPMDIKDKLDLDQIGTPVDATKYHSMIGALMYLTSSRPDIVHVTCDSGFELTGFLDADYVGRKDTFKSTSCRAQFLGEKIVSCSSKKQDCTSLSTLESKNVYLSSCCTQVLWMQTQLIDYGYHFNKIPIYCDSKSAIAISCNPVQHSKTKHIAVRYHFIKEHVEKGTFELYFVKTDYQLADIFTKALPVDRFTYLVRRLGIHSLCPQELDHLAYQNQRDLPKDTPIDSLEVLRYVTGKRSKVRMRIMPTEIELTLEQTRQVTMEIILAPSSNKLLVGDVGDSIWIELVTLDINLGPK
nr:copia protein [Tanacetum cinerariifolium]